MKKHRILSLLLAAIMLIPANVTALAYDRTSKEPPSSTERVEQLRNSGLESLESAGPIDPLEEITAIVTLETQPVVAESSAGGRQVRNRAVMLRQQTAVQKKISSQVLDGEPVEVLHTYTAAANGFAIKVAYGKLDEIRALPGVASAYPAPEFKVAPDMESATTELGGLENSSGYQGEGMVIAILDTGLEISHKSFAAAPTSPALTEKDIEAVLSGKTLNAEQKKTITASQVYHTAKVPFAFDYADNDLDVNPGNAGDHGIHVSGIAAANAGVVSDVVGTAPQAQILAMKVFSSSGSNGATWDDILAAADDAVTLGADVINMSLGSTCGFSTPEGEEGVAEVLDRIADNGVLLSISAGNEYSAALGTRIGKGHALTANPDYGTVASPSSYSGPLSVASVEKADTIDSCYLTVGDRKVAFNDTAEDTTASGVDENSKSFRSLAGTELSYVVVPNAGEAKDYDGLDVNGKIALVSRGSVEYNVKKEAAKNAGAAGILVYNNEPGMLYMQLDKYDLPSAFISQADGKALAALEESARKLTVSASYGKVDNPTSGEMSDFSSWGVTPELTLKPDITAPGGNIKSATFNNGYTTKSGTSMAAPYVSGAMAVVKQYVEQQNYANSETDKAELVSDLLMSTADLVMAGTAPYSPRKQGAGSVNIAAATAAKAYLTAEDGTRPKVELGDDAQKSGSYTVKFQLHNLSDENLTYTLGGYIQTDGQEVTKQIGGEDVHQVTELPYLLGRIEAQTVTVPSKGTVTVTVPVGLTEANKAYLDANFKNGTYVEGFVTLTPESSAQPTLSIPYMGFYGDWTQAPIIDATDYGDVLNGADSWSQAYTNTAASSSLEGTVNTYLGDNPYHSGTAYLSDRNAISPNDDDYMDSLSFVYTGLLRNVKSLTYAIKDEKTGEVYYSNDVEYETKSVYSTNHYQIIPSGVEDYSKFSWDGTKKDHSKVPNDTKVIVTVSGQLSYDKHGVNNQKSSWSFPITIDTEEPEAKDITVRNENGKYFVDLTVSDNQFVSNVTISNSAQTKELASYPVVETKAGAETTCSYDITGFGENLVIVVNDYACNRKTYSVKAEGNADASEVIVPTKTVLTEDFEETSFPPDGWSLKSQAAKTWYQGTEYGSKMAMVDISKTEQQDEWLISPKIDLSAQTTKAGMVFDFYTNYYWSVQNHYHNLKVMASTDGEAWEQIWQLWDWNPKNEFNAWEKTQAQVSIPDKFQNEEAVQFAFVYQGKDSTSLWLDNVQVYVEDPSQIHTITATAGEGGSIDPSGTVQINDGKSKTFTITPDEGYFLSDVKVDGESIGPKTSYTFTNVKADHTITAEFTARTGGGKAVLLEENFQNCTKNGDFPDGWTLESTNSASTWTVYEYYYADKTLTASCGDDYTNYAKQDERLITPALDMSSGGGAVSFRYIGGKTPTTSGDYTVKLEGSKDGKTWTTIWTSTELKNAAYDEIGYSGNTLSASVAVNIPAELQSAATKLAFRYERPAGENSGRGAVDDIRIMANKSSSGGEESTLLDENFDDCITSGYSGNIPSDWTQAKKNSGIYTWRTYKTSDHITAYCTNDSTSQSDGWGGDEEWGAGQDEYLITPELDLSGKTANMTFQFSANRVNQIQETLSRSGTTFTLEASTDGGTTWNPIWNAASIVAQLTETVISSSYKTANVTVEIPAEFQAASVKFAFRYQTKNGNTGGCTVLIDDVKVTAIGGGETPTPPAETFTITASAGQGGSITPSGAVTVEKNGSQTFTITPSEGYEIAAVIVDGTSQGAVDTYTFENVTEAHTITASFTEKAVTLPDSIHEDFNSGSLPAGWTVEGPSASYNYESWKIDYYRDWRSDAAVCAANYMGGTAQNELLILPEITMQSSMQLGFDFAASYAQLSTGNLKLTVKASLNKGQTWTEIWNAQDHMGEIDEDNTPEDVTGTGSLSIPASYCVPGARFAFVFESTAKTGASAAIDNVVFKAGEAPAPIDRYGITIAPMTNGTVTADKATAAAGETVTLTVTPDAGYHLKDGSLMANDEVVTGNTFTMPGKEVRVTALFAADDAAPDTGSYKDGTYTGSAKGHSKDVPVTVTVTVVNGSISSIDVTEQNESEGYWEKAVAIIEKLLGLGNDDAVSNVDTIGGATQSSTAIKEAVQNALKNAAQEDSGIFDGGSGTQQSPYLISTIDTLMKFAESVNDGEDYDRKYVALACDLDISGETWTPIGRVDHGKTSGFAGTFDGRGYTVSNLTCGTAKDAKEYEAVGFFGVIAEGGTVKNLNVHINKIYTDYDLGSYIISGGGLAGILEENAVIDHCSVSGGNQVISVNAGSKAAIGGLVGQMESGSLVANSWTDVGLNYGTISMEKADIYMGGICGRQAANSLIANSASFGSVPGMLYDGTLYVGGLAGYTSGALYNCYTSSLTKAQKLSVAASEFATTAIGHLIGASETGAALYDCYYDKSADQFNNADLAADPDEGKTERRQATGWVDANVKTDESFIEAMTASQLVSDEFAALLNNNTKNNIKKAASAYFAQADLLEDSVSDLEDVLDDGFCSWTLTDGRVLFGDEAVERVTVTFVELLEQQTVPVGTAETALDLPETVEVTLSDRTKETLGVSWKCDSYNGNTPGSYTFEGTLALTGGITNPKSLKAYVVVVVEDGGQPVTKYQVTVSGGSGSGTYTVGTIVTIKANTPASGYAFNGWTATGVTLADASASTTTFVMPGHDVRIAANWKSTGSGGGGSSGGGSSSGGSSGGSTVSGATYPISQPGSTANGTVTVSPANAAKGSRVTITATPASGYVLDKLMVTDASGNLLGLTNQGGGKFTFTMPGSAVTVQAAFGQESGGVFADVPNSAYYADAVKWAVAQGITNGKGSGLFGSNDACTRAQIVTFLWRAAGSPAPKMTFNPFSDVSPDAYYYQAVLWAVENGITGGMDNGRFSPEGTCTRGQSVTFLHRAAGAPAVSGSSFQDVPASSYCADAIAWAVKNGITQGTGAGAFSPNGGCTRAQIVTFLYRQYK